MRVLVIKGCPEGVDHRAECDRIYNERAAADKAKNAQEAAQEK